MNQVAPFENHTAEYEAWFEEYEYVFQSEILALSEQLNQLPDNIHGIQVGIGTGRYAIPLGIKEGIEPSENMRNLAIKKGLETMDAVAENLPYKDLHFDFVLFATIEHLDNVREAFKDAYRVLKPNGSIIVGFIDKTSSIGKQYEQKKSKSTFYKHAVLYDVEKVQELLKEAGFKNLVFNQTLFGDLDVIKEVQEPLEGYGKGSYIVAKAGKN